MPKVKAAVLERSRRSTAGKRMESLVGKAQDDDDTFWSHSIWAETGGGFSDGAGRKRRRSGDDGDTSSASSGDEGGSGSGDDEGSSQSDGEGSYRMSEDDASAAVDQFDSDFDESESDEDEGDEGGEGEEERELRLEERREKANKRKKNQRLGHTMQPLKKATSAGRELMRKKTGGGKVGKRGPLGTGWNEGLVLNWPPPPLSSLGTAVATTAGVGAKKPVVVTAQQPVHHAGNKSATVQSTEPSTSIPDATTSQTLPQHIASKPAAPIDVKAPAKPSLKTGTIPTPVAMATATIAVAAPPLPKVKPPPSPKQSRQRQKSSSQPTTKKSTKIRHQITQEQMIIESIQSTETTNSKWINARKRTKEEAIQKEKAHAAAKNRANATKTQVSRFYSRRGRHNILTFMDMDHLPDILTRRHHHGSSTVASTPAAVSSRRGGGGIAQHHRSPATTTKRRRMDSTTSENSESILPTTTTAATSTSTTSAAAPAEETNPHEKCVITGKIARYRDPKTMLGYHDIDAYKEIKRRLEAGELKVAAVRNDNRRRSGSGKESGSNNNATIHKSHFPFDSDKPTMVATLSMTGAMTKKKSNVKVMVTQGGCPVSPPTTKRPSKSTATKESSVTGDRKKPPELQLPAQNNLNGKKPVAGSDNIGKTNKDAAVITDTSNNQQQVDTKAEPQPLSAPSGTSTAVGGTKNGSSSLLSKAAAAPPEVLSNELQTAFFEKPTAPAPAPAKKRGRGRPPKQKPVEKSAAALVNPIQQLQQPQVAAGIGPIGAVKTEAVPAPAVLPALFEKPTAPTPAPVKKRGRGRPPKQKPVEKPAVAIVNPIQQLQQPQVAAGIGLIGAVKTEAVPAPAVPVKRKRGRPPKAKPAAPAVPQQPQVGADTQQQTQTTAGGAAAPAKRKRGRPPKAKPAVPTPVPQQPQMVAGMPAALMNPMQLQQTQFAAGMPAALMNPMQLQQAQFAAGMPAALVNPMQMQQAQFAAGIPSALAALMNPLQQSQMAVGMPYALVNPIQQHQMAAMTNLLMNPTVPVNPIQQSQIPAPKVNDQVGNGKKVGVQPKVSAVAVHQPLGTTGKQGPVANNNNEISKSATAVTKTSPKSIHQMKDEQP